VKRLQDDLSPLALRNPEQAANLYDVQDAVKDLQAYAESVLAAARLKGRQDFVERVLQADQQRGALADRAKRDAAGAMREVRRLLGEVGRMEQELSSGWSPATLPLEGMLEGSA